MSIQKCQNRLPDVKYDGYTLSLLCQRPKGHEGDCKPDDRDVEILSKHVLPDCEDRYYPKIG